jgi:hypothetical protein
LRIDSLYWYYEDLVCFCFLRRQVAAWLRRFCMAASCFTNQLLDISNRPSQTSIDSYWSNQAILKASPSPKRLWFSIQVIRGGFGDNSGTINKP